MFKKSEKDSVENDTVNSDSEENDVSALMPRLWQC